MVLERTRALARRQALRCGYRAALRFIASNSYISLEQKLEGILAARKVKDAFYNCIRIDGFEAMQGYIDLGLIGIDKNIPIYLPPYDYGLSRDLLIYGIREPIHVKVLFECIKENGVFRILDVGANIGYFPLIELAAGAKEIVAVEPVPYTYRYLSLNLRGCSPCRLLNAAVDIEEGQKKIFIPYSHDGKPLLNQASLNRQIFRGNQPIQEYTIKSVRLADLLYRNKVDLLRTDIEGYEWTLFSSIGELPDNIYAIDFEVHEGPMEQVKRVFLGFEKNGFVDAIVILNYKVPLLPIRVLARLVGAERSYSLFNTLILSNTTTHCKRNYPFIKAINATRTKEIIRQLDAFMGITGTVQILLLRRY